MNTGKTLFAQLMDFLPWSTFSRIVSRYDGDRAVRTLSCAAFRVMAFAQLTYRESLRDIEACLSAQAGKLYHMGFRDRVHRSTLADTNEARDWRIYAEFAQQLIGQARPLYAGDDLGVDLSNTVYALDSTTIDLWLSVFPWAHFRSTKGAADGPDRGADLRPDHRARWPANPAGLLRIKRLYGTSENAVKTQIWIAVSVYVLVAIVRKRLGLGGVTLHIAAGHFRHSIRKDADPDCLLRTGQPER